MSGNEFTIKRKGNTVLYLIPLFLLIYPFIHNEYLNFMTPIADKTSILVYILISVIVLFTSFPLLQFTVKVTEEHIVVNKVSSISYEEIQKVYIGKFSYIESFEERDKLPLLPFKHKALEGYFKEKEGHGFPSGYFLVLHTQHNLFFIKASYFDKQSFLKLVLALDSKNIQIEAEQSFLKEKAF